MGFFGCWRLRTRERGFERIVGVFATIVWTLKMVAYSARETTSCRSTAAMR